MLESVVHAIGDRAIVVEAGENFLDLAHDIIGAGDVEEGFLLPGEARVGQILRCRRRAHRDGDFATAVVHAEFRVGIANLEIQIPLERCIDHPAADFRARAGQCGDILDI